MSELHDACSYGHTDTARSLLEKGADVNTQDKNGSTSLHQACGYGRTDITRLLLRKGADVTARDEDGVAPVDLALDLPPDNPDREEILDLFRQYAPEQVMEAYCTGQEDN